MAFYIGYCIILCIVFYRIGARNGYNKAKHEEWAMQSREFHRNIEAIREKYLSQRDL